MWYSGDGWSGATGIGYAESADGMTGWTKYSGNPVITNYHRGNIVHNGSTFYEFAKNFSTNNMDVLTSPDSDGLTWTLAASNVLTKGSSGAFDQDAIENSSMFNDGGTWTMVYEGNNGGDFECGGATATALTGPWTKVNSGNLIISGPGCSGPWIAKVGSNYWVWAAQVVAHWGIARWTATSLAGPWTLNPDRSTYFTGQTFYPASPDELTTDGGGLADGWHLEVNGSTYKYYTGTNAGTSVTGHSHIKLTIAPMPISTLVTTIEGMTSNTP
jgi:hypothetical protein